MYVATLIANSKNRNLSELILKDVVNNLGGIKFPFGTLTPEVVPFQVNTTSLSKFILLRSGNFP